MDRWALPGEKLPGTLSLWVVQVLIFHISPSTRYFDLSSSQLEILPNYSSTVINGKEKIS